jgi:integrative and conjugative element protein (TIGR02256 family)
MLATSGSESSALDANTLRVTEVSPPGPRAVKLPFYFSRDTRFLQRWLQRRYGLSGGRDDYVGEWHVHHALDAPPSCVDRRSLWRIARRSNYPTDTPILLIVEHIPEQRRTRAYGFAVKPAKMCQELAVDTERLRNISG